MIASGLLESVKRPFVEFQALASLSSLDANPLEAQRRRHGSQRSNVTRGPGRRPRSHQAQLLGQHAEPIIGEQEAAPDLLDDRDAQSIDADEEGDDLEDIGQLGDDCKIDVGLCGLASGLGDDVGLLHISVDDAAPAATEDLPTSSGGPPTSGKVAPEEGLGAAGEMAADVFSAVGWSAALEADAEAPAPATAPAPILEIVAPPAGAPLAGAPPVGA